jgi:perosamine synthetase
MIGEEEKRAALRVLDSGQLAQGEEVAKFEEEFARYIGVDHAIAVSSGTTALVIANALIPKEIKRVHVPAFTFIATANSVHPRMDVVFHDINPHDPFNHSAYCIDGSFKLRHDEAAIPVHLFGNVADIITDSRVSESFAIEDCAQAAGASIGSRMAGSIGDVGAFSFYATKNMTTGGEGGMLTTNRLDLARRARLFRNHGDAGKYDHVCVGTNFRMTEMQAAIGREQLKKLDDFNAKRRMAAFDYDSHIDVDGIFTPSVLDDVYHVYHQYVLYISDACSLTRDEFASYLISNGIGCAVHYPMPVTDQPCIRSPGRFGFARLASRHCISIPVGPWVSTTDRDHIIEVINSVE